MFGTEQGDDKVRGRIGRDVERWVMVEDIVLGRLWKASEAITGDANGRVLIGGT